MNDLWQRLAEKKVLDPSLRLEIEETLGTRGKKALVALDAGKIKKYLDFFVVEGRTAEYVVDEDFCTCSDFLYRGRTCWHLLAVRIAQETGTFRHIDSWYQDTWKNKPEQ
jgi:predicted nucleic acid-binding Zn finger protein